MTNTALEAIASLSCKMSYLEGAANFLLITDNIVIYGYEYFLDHFFPAWIGKSYQQFYCHKMCVSVIHQQHISV